MTETKEQRARYIEIGGDNANIDGKIRVECCRWEVQGLHHVHQFRYIVEAETSTHFILHRNIVEHWLHGKLVGHFEWGHGQVEAYSSSQKWSESHRKGDYDYDLVSAHVFRCDLPCCGGTFVVDRAITDYCCINVGHCDKCGQKWEETDGHHLTKPLRVDEAGLTH